ncbi:MAG: hypothetical protein PUB22_02190 [Clostridiales bacterium]|nr:hypothetical protein [Clostridiales bacterium]
MNKNAKKVHASKVAGTFFCVLLFIQEICRRYALQPKKYLLSGSASEAVSITHHCKE